MLWGSRFKKKFDDAALEFSSSLSFDINLIEWDIKVSKAHANMLSKIGILSVKENVEIEKGLDTILFKYNDGSWIPCKNKFEDVHSAVEAELTNIIDDVGKKLHTARSRNHQVITDVRLWLKNSVSEIISSIQTLQKNSLNFASQHVNTLMPGYTHLQRAQPISFAFHLLAYVEILERDKERFVEEIDGSFMLATDLADYLVLKGIPFREAHNILGKIVEFASDKDKKLNQLNLEDYKKFSPYFEQDVFNYLSAKTCLLNKKTYGSPNPNLVEKSINNWMEKLN